MIRKEISLFLRNAPGELAVLAQRMSGAGINIDALTIQDASDYVKEIFRARGKSLKRIASVASYQSMTKDSADFALVRFLTDPFDTAVEILENNDYVFDVTEVIALKLPNRPGSLFEMADRFGQNKININYVYGSVSSPDEKCLFVFCPEDVKLAAKLLMEDD
ncbi:amino acid-binding protein [Desulfobacterales bacterium HSG17]|nr:amino acid-binding protein [Desulfobacterales bacterium HSG17]